MSEKRIAELEEELAREKRLKIEKELDGTLGVGIDNALKAWRLKLEPLRANKTGKLVLKIYPIAGPAWRASTRQIWERREFKWTLESYRDCVTDEWTPLCTVFGDSVEELAPTRGTILTLAGILYFIHKTDHDFRPVERIYERQGHLFNQRALSTKARFDAFGWDSVAIEFDATDSMQLGDVFRKFLSFTRDLQLKQSIALHEKIATYIARIEHMKAEIARIDKESNLIVTDVFPFSLLNN